MKKLLDLNKSGPGPGTYNDSPIIAFPKTDYAPVVVECFFKGAAKCLLCGCWLYGDYYRDARRKRTFSWCLECFRFSLPTMPRAYVDSIRKCRHCSFVHKHIDVENIVYHVIPKYRVRRMFLKEKAMWNKYGDMRDKHGLPV